MEGADGMCSEEYHDLAILPLARASLSMIPKEYKISIVDAVAGSIIYNVYSHTFET